jgi:SAM-dependent methyltransferase
MSNRFAEIYANNEWGHGSGEGSLEIHTRGYRNFLQNFLKEKRIGSVVDMGCGDWQFSRHIDWSGVRYQGFDVVPAVIAANHAQFGKPNVSFQLYSGQPAELPAADLLIAKDVLQHLPHQTVFEFLAGLSRFKYALLTNCVNPKGETDNIDIAAGEFRYLDLRKPPFNLTATQVYGFSKNEPTLRNKLRDLLRGHADWRKIVLLVDNSRTS